MKGLLAVVGCALALLPSAAASSGLRAPTPKAATAALGHFLHQLYGGDVRGYWTCPPPAVLGRVDCLAEFHAERRWHQVSTSARLWGGSIAFETFANRSAQTWVRRWSPYSRHFIVRSREDAPGVVSVNSPAYDWGWLAATCAGGVHAGQTRQCDAYDGNDSGIARFEIFTCTRSGAVITCRNRLGDAMRYRPHG